ncbi:hypothetical protein Moror_10915 [Moniliophthora roreri MCA 2997]|uniref:Uncharacterized protein n=1 Tax=Moniliophthora roreri (strain MCA 2997) TaxID=1381753 RepID=V2WKH9_MONRO|nr:hypothetical protein Moror_10915 [Moniliophthora roreri MCA 2997]
MSAWWWCELKRHCHPWLRVHPSAWRLRQHTIPYGIFLKEKLQLRLVEYRLWPKLSRLDVTLGATGRASSFLVLRVFTITVNSGTLLTPAWGTFYVRRASGAGASLLKTYTWISLWFLLIFPDAGYCLMRPGSMIGDGLHWFWAPYEIYQETDLVYSVEALSSGEGLANALTFLNIVETLLISVYLHKAHVSTWPATSLIGLVSASLTISVRGSGALFIFSLGALRITRLG